MPPEKSRGIESSILEKAYEQVSKAYQNDILPALQMLRAEHIVEKGIGSITPEKIQSWKNAPINVDSKLFVDYRKYYDHPAEESHETLTLLSTYGVGSRDVHYQYSQITRDTLLRRQKIDTILDIDTGKSEQTISEELIKDLSLDTYLKLDAKTKESAIQKGLDKLGLKIKDGVPLNPENMEKIRLYLCMHYGNIALKPVVPKNGDIHVRSSIGALLGEINKRLGGTGYQLGVENGYRSSERQRVAKENRARTHGSVEANKLFADEGKSDHQTGGAIDVILLGSDGKKVNLDFFKDKKSQVKLMDGESLVTEKGWEKLSPQEKQAIEGRRMVYHIMKAAGFTELETEHWHYALGARLPALVESRKKSLEIGTEVTVPAWFGSLNNAD